MAEMNEEELKAFEKALAKARAELKEMYNIQKEINSGWDGFTKGVKDVSNLTSDIKNVNKQILELEKDQTEEGKLKVAALKKELALLEKNRDVIKQTIKDVNKFKLAGGTAMAGVVKGASNLDKIPNFITGKLGLLKGLFEMDKAIRVTVNQMGTLGKQSDIVRQNIKSAAVNTVSFGVGIKEIAEIQAQYAESLGRNVLVSQKGLEAIAEMGKSSGLGIEGATEMAAQFDKMGVSADRTGEFMEETLNNSSAMGLNTTKVMKNLNQNFKMLNKYRFKDGIKGITKMAQMATKLGVEMDFAAGMSDKLWNVEGAVEMSAQLNVMGGAWAQMADPFKLMYQARNDMQGLTEDIAKAASQSMTFAKDGSIETNAMEMHRLKIIAEQTGLEYEKLVELGKTQFKMGKIEMQASNLPDDVKEFVANTAEFKNGKAYIQVESGDKKLLSHITKADRDYLKRQVEEKKTMKERADAAQSFDETLNNLLNMVKIYMMPIVEGLSNVLKPVIDDLMGEKGTAFKNELKSLGEQLGNFISGAAEWVKPLIQMAVALGPKGIFYTWLTGKALMGLFEVGKWFLNGLSLSKGFLMGTKGFMGGSGNSTPNTTTSKGSGKFGKFGSTKGGMSFGKSLMRGLGSGAVLGVGGAAMDYGRSKMDDPESTGGKWLGAGAKAAEFASYGAMIGSIIPGLGTGAGAIIGGLIGGGKGIYDEFFDKPQNDVKFPKLGPNHSKGRMLTQGGKITPIDNKDELLAMKPGGVVDKTLNNTNAGVSSTKIEFGDLNITGEIKVTLPGGTQIGSELLKSSEFKSSITRVVQSQLEKNINGKNSDRK